MVRSGLSFLKTLIKSSLDNYVLPGTLTGTQILLLYMSHWKRNFYRFFTAALYLVSAEWELLKAEETPVTGETLSDCTVEIDQHSEAP